MLEEFPGSRIGANVVRYVGKVCDAGLDHVIPRERNGYHPHALKHRVLLGYSAILILVKALAIGIPIALPSASVYSSAITTANIVSLTNTARASLGLQELTINAALSRAAELKAQDMVASQYFAHKSPAGLQPWNFIRGQGYDYLHAAENLAIYFTEAEDVQAGWMASPTHRANIVSPKYTEIGVGVVHGTYEGHQTVFVVQMFGTPKPVEQPVIAAVPPAEPVIPPPAQPSGTEPVVVQPVAVEPVVPPVEPEPVQKPLVKEETVKVVKKDAGYKVTLEAPAAQAVNVAIGQEVVSLSPVEQTETWTGEIPALELIAQEEAAPVVALVTDENGSTSGTVIAVVSPSPAPAELYLVETSAEPKPFKLFGMFRVDGLQDGVRRFYVYAIIGLAAVILLSLAVKFHRQKPGVMAHALGVLVLAGILALL